MSKQKIIKIVSIIGGIIVIFILGALITYNVMLSPVSKDTTSITFEIPYKTTSNEVLESLKDSGLIKNVTAAKIYMKLNIYEKLDHVIDAVFKKIFRCIC